MNPRSLRIASFLPAATEMAYALGLGDQVVGRSHECDYPPDARSKPVLVRPAMDLAGLGLAQIDVAVSARARSGQSIYAVDEERLIEAAPDLILTQDLCHVCAPSGNDITGALARLRPAPEILFQSPRSFADVLDALRQLGARTGKAELAGRLATAAEARMRELAARTAALGPPIKVSFLEWVDPLFCGGHWVPSQLAWAGGRDALARDGTDSVRITWDEVRAWDPEALIVAPCGFGAAQAREQAERLKGLPGWGSLAAVRARRIFAVDAGAYFARPGLRLADGAELLAHLLHPSRIPWTGPADAFLPVDP
jgi:iron complex transport system substrate-binding protein